MEDEPELKPKPPPSLFEQLAASTHTPSLLEPDAIKRGFVDRRNMFEEAARRQAEREQDGNRN